MNGTLGNAATGFIVGTGMSLVTGNDLKTSLRLGANTAASAGTKCSIEESHWKELAEAIDKTNPNFRLTIDPLNELRETDYRVCMLDYIGFSPSDIAFFFNMSESFASKIRKRLHYKIFGDEGKPADFDRRIRSI